MSSPFTLVCVHAHPDDEVFFGAGATALYAARGHRVVLITCTNGRLGLDDAGHEGDAAGHDALMTVSTRAGELQRAAALLGFSRVVTLGYEDSGMKGWPTNERPEAFMNADVDAVARTIASICNEVGASVLLTYDENGFYGHPDHVQANVVTRRALDFTTSVERLYYPVVPRGVITSVVEVAARDALSMPAWVSDAATTTPDESVATTLDVRAFVRTKRDAIAIHASQSDHDDLVRMDDALFTLLFGTEYYQRAWSRREAQGDGADLFGGL